MKSLKLFTLLLMCFAFLQINAQNNGLEFDGTDDYVTVADDASLNITGAITVEAWIYAIDNISQYQRIVEKDWATSFFLGSGYGPNGFAFSMDPDGDVANVVETPDNILFDFIWTHVAGTWDGSTLKLYVNGELLASKPWTNASVTGSTNDVLIGKYYGNSTQNWEGKIDEVRIWNVARTEAQIRANMYKELESPGSETNLVAYYPFNNGSGQTSPDMSANSNTATLGATTNVEVTDPTWITSNIPTPYRTTQDGVWQDVDTWIVEMGYPFKDWAIVTVDHDITFDTDESTGSLTINPAGTVTVPSGYSLTVLDGLTIKSAVAGTGSFIDHGTYTGASATVERYFAEDEWHLIGTPVSDETAGIFTGMYLQSYTEATQTWTDIVNINTPLNAMQGYALWIPPSTTYTAEFTGTLNTGAQSMGFTAANAFGWNLMGNPYPSSVDWDAVVPVANMNSAIYYLDAATGNYVSYVSGVGASRYIPPMQGFWISATGSGTLSFDNSDRTHVNKDTYYKDENSLLVINAEGNNLNDKLYLNFNNEASAQFDEQHDAYKLLGGFNDELPQIYSFADDKMLSIDARPETEMISVGFESGVNGSFTISMDETTDYSSVILEDLFTGSLTQLLDESYTFDYNTADDNNRFVLHFTMVGVNDEQAGISEIYAFGSQVYINTAVNDAVYYIYNVTGQQVSEGSLVAGPNQISVDNAGSYIVKVVTNQGVSTEKIYIQ